MAQATTLNPIQDLLTSSPDDLSFDYQDIDSADATALEHHADSILETAEAVRKATAEGVLKIGRELALANRLLANTNELGGRPSTTATAISVMFWCRCPIASVPHVHNLNSKGD